MSIISLLNQIRSNEVVLPAIQRDFVWPEEKVLRLLDSIMRGYPIGIALLWETYLDLQYRHFEQDYRSDAVKQFKENKRRNRLKIVLDGQQRLQSLYIALYGSYGGKDLYFDALSGRESDDLAEEKFAFRFMNKADFAKWIKNSESPGSEPPSGHNGHTEFFVRVADLFASGVKERVALTKRIRVQLNLSDEDGARLETNLARFDEALTKNQNILKVSVIDEHLPSDNPDRKSEADVLEIFVRVNREGTPLSRSDLVFSMLKLNWKESAETLPEFVLEVNKGNSFGIDTDFVIRCLFAVSDLGTKFDLDRLRRKQNVVRLRENFTPCCNAIRSTLDAVSRECWCSSSGLIGGLSTLVPFVYWLFHTPNHQVPTGSLADFRKAFYLFAFARPFSRYGDSRLGRFIREELQASAVKGECAFPFRAAVSWVRYWEYVQGIDGQLLQSNVPLTLHTAQKLPGDKAYYRPNAGELDHIFPRSVLRKKGFQEADINHFANFWILAKSKNQNKSNRHPAEYFADVSDSEMLRAFIDRESLDYRRFTTFLKAREERLVSVVKRRLGFTEADFVDDEEETQD